MVLTSKIFGKYEVVRNKDGTFKKWRKIPEMPNINKVGKK